LIALIILSYLFGLAIFYSCFTEITSPVGSVPKIEDIMQIDPGMGVINIGSILEKKGFIRNALAFQLVSILNGSDRSLKAGNYLINSDMSMLQIIRLIASGDNVLYRFTIPEGFTALEIAGLWEQKGFGNASDFIRELNDPEIAKKYNISSVNLEGYLFPDTYLIPHSLTEHEAINMMIEQFNRKVPEIIGAKSKNINLSNYEIISLASIIEKEAKVENERPLISAVFHNRLRLDQKLESCATVLYSLGYPDRKLTYNDLRDVSSDYNTYVYKGLPPGPICNPGLNSIIAAVNPSKDKYLYFVSKNDGTHYFTENYNDFLRAKKKYQGT